MGASSKRKGTRRELELAHLLGGTRQPLSGALSWALGPPMAGDVVAGGLRWECKARATGFRQLYSWLSRVDALALKADRQPWLVCVPLETWLRLTGQVDAEPEQAEAA